MAADDIADDSAMIFTEADVYMVGGFLAELWDVDEDATERTQDIEAAITAALNGDS